MRGRPPVLPGSVIIRHRIRFLRSCVISSFVILHREHSLRHRFKQAPCQNRRYSLCRRVSPTGVAVFTPPQAAPSAAMFSLPNDGFPSLLSRYFSALQSGVPVTAGPQAVCRTPLPFPAVFAVSAAFFGNSVLLLPDLCVYFAQSIQRKRRDKPAALSLRSSSDGYPSQR